MRGAGQFLVIDHDTLRGHRKAPGSGKPHAKFGRDLSITVRSARVLKDRARQGVGFEWLFFEWGKWTKQMRVYMASGSIGVLKKHKKVLSHSSKTIKK